MKKYNKKNKNHLKKDFDKLNKNIDNLEKTLRQEIGFTTNEAKQELKREFKEEMSKNTGKILDHFDQFIQEMKALRA